MSAKKLSKRTLAKAREMLALCQNVEADPQMRAAVRSAMERPAPQRAPEEVAARVGLAIHAMAAVAAHSHPEIADKIEPVLALVVRGEALGEPPTDAIKIALRDLFRWASDGADPETAAALQAAAGEMSK